MANNTINILPATTVPADPRGYEFYDGKSGRFMRLIYEGEWKNWIVYKHPDGSWVTTRIATNDDWHALAKALSATHHSA